MHVACTIQQKYENLYETSRLIHNEMQNRIIFFDPLEECRQEQGPSTKYTEATRGVPVVVKNLQHLKASLTLSCEKMQEFHQYMTET